MRGSAGITPGRHERVELRQGLAKPSHFFGHAGMMRGTTWGDAQHTYGETINVKV